MWMQMTCLDLDINFSVVSLNYEMMQSKVDSFQNKNNKSQISTDYIVILIFYNLIQHKT